MDRATASAWLRLLSLEFRSSRLMALLRTLDGPQAILDASSEQLAAAGLRPPDIGRLRQAPQPQPDHLGLLESGAVSIVCIRDDRYPTNLRQLADGEIDVPPVLCVRGNVEPDDRYAVAVVGTRKPTAYGVMVAERLARDFARAGLRVVSGGAAGIDTAAHRGAMDGGGRSLVALGCGVNVSYPSTNRQLFERIAQNGALLSEFPLGAAPDYWRFPVRNRTISGLSLGVVVVEAPERSGALITASCAAEQGRDVFVVPGSVDAPNSKGSHALLKDGAILIESAEDVLSALGIVPSEKPQPAKQAVVLTSIQQKIVGALSLEPVHPDALARQLDIPQPQLATELTMLEVRGVARRLPGGAYVRVL